MALVKSVALPPPGSPSEAVRGVLTEASVTSLSTRELPKSSKTPKTAEWSGGASTRSGASAESPQQGSDQV